MSEPDNAAPNTPSSGPIPSSASAGASASRFCHEPPGYSCPFCALAAGRDTEVMSGADIVRRTERALAVVSPRWWPNNHGHVLAVPVGHHENLYELPADDGHAVHDVVQEVAVAMRHTYGCHGVSTRQHNEPAGNQDVWHYHVHVFPRYPEDRLYETRPEPELIPAERRLRYALRLRDWFG